jgi:hypothetical protein
MTMTDAGTATTTLCARASGLFDRTLCFFDIRNAGDGIDNYKELAGIFAALLLILVIAFNLWQAMKAILLVQRMNPGRKRGSLPAALITVLEIFVRHPFSLFQQRWNLYARMRMRVEHEIFDPRPDWIWPSRGGRSAGDRGWIGGFLDFAKRRVLWHGRMWLIARDQCIQIPTAGDVNDAFDAIARYFEVIDTLGFVAPPKPSFVCEAEVAHGYIAPLHLLTGLLVQHNQKWNRILQAFGAQTRSWTDVPMTDQSEGSERMSARDFRQLQSFIYHCWLLWGPSIPICQPNCANWAGGYVSLQYGYGDENNSIEIVGDREKLSGAFRGLIDDYATQGVMALPARVRGVFQYSSSASLTNGKFPSVLETSWRGGQDARPVLFYSEGQPGDAVTGVRPAGEKIVGELIFDKSNDRPGAPVSRYYSAYLWIMFVVLREDEETGKWRPLAPDQAFNPRRAAEPWKGTIPFFEHGNIADAQSCAFAKQVLADKVIGAMFQFVTHWGKREFPLRFAYAGAIDEGNCGHDVLFPDFNGGDTIRARIEKRLADLPLLSPLRRLMREGVISWDHFSSADYNHPHSACSLPQDIKKYYECMDAV